jgi:predicted DNA-binding transcriptional regulator
MAKHPVYYQALAIQNEIAWLQTLIQAGGVEETIKVDGKSRKITRDPKTGQFGRGGSSAEVSQDDKFGKMGPSKPGDAAYEKKGAGPIPESLENPKSVARAADAVNKEPEKAMNGIKERLKKIPASLSVSAEKVNKPFKEAAAGISAQLEKAGKTDMAKAVKDQASSMAKSIEEMKNVTAKKLGDLATSDAAKMTGAVALTFAASVAGLAIGGAIAGELLGAGWMAGSVAAATNPALLTLAMIRSAMQVSFLKIEQDRVKKEKDKAIKKDKELGMLGTAWQNESALDALKGR